MDDVMENNILFNNRDYNDVLGEFYHSWGGILVNILKWLMVPWDALLALKETIMEEYNCGTCLLRNSMMCPNSSECYSLEDKPFWTPILKGENKTAKQQSWMKKDYSLVGPAIWYGALILSCLIFFICLK